MQDKLRFHDSTEVSVGRGAPLEDGLSVRGQSCSSSSARTAS